MDGEPLRMPFHDALFKTLLQAFFADLLRLVVPEAVGALNLASVKFLRDEFFTDLPAGERRQADLLAQVSSGKPDETPPLLVHVEIEAKARKSMPERLWRYSLLIQSHHQQFPLQILIQLRGGRPGARKEVYQGHVRQVRVLTSHYWVLSLAPSSAQKFLARREPLAWALAALMRPGTWSRARLKLECLRRIADAEVDEARRYLLVNCVQSYLELDETEEKEYQSMLAKTPNRDVAEMEMTWGDRLIAQGRTEGERLGRTEGERLGRAEGERRGMKQVLLHLLAQRFGALPAVVVRRVGAIDSTRELNRLTERILTAHSLEELGLA